MSLAVTLSKLTNPSWLAVPQELIVHKGILGLSKHESRALLETARKAIEARDSREAANHLYAGLLLDGQRFLAELQKVGLFRISRLSYLPEPLTSIVTALRSPDLGLSQEVTDYLGSIANLYDVAHPVREEYQKLLKWLGTEKEVGIKSALACLDLLFLKMTIGFHETDKVRLQSRHPYFFTVEEMAEGFSSLLALYGNEFGELNHVPPINVEACLRGDYFSILNAAAHISAFREWEFQVDRQGYQLVPTGQANEYRLLHPSPEFHRAVEMGFIHAAQQRTIKTFEWLKDGGNSFHDFALKLVKLLEEAGLIEVVEKPVARLRFSYPEEMLKQIARVELFLEERLALRFASRDLLTAPDQILDFEILDGLTFHDLLLVSRLIHFLRSIAAAKLIPEMKDRIGLVFQSIVPVYQKNHLIELLSKCVTKEKAEAAIRMWTTDVKGHVDIQYRPIIPAGPELLLAANVFASANVYRNPLMILRKRLYEDGTVDPLSLLLDKKFKEKGHSSRTGVIYDQGEIDVLVLIDGILFALECKNSLVPTGPHELMTSLDYLRTAADQLDRFKGRMSHRPFRVWLAAETGWPIDDTTHLSTGIILSNRMFMGLRLDAHPVRGAYELEHFIDDGTITMGEEFHRFWKGDALSGEDLRRFLDEDITYQAQWNCLKGFSAEYQFNERKVFVDHLFMDLPALAEQYGFEQAKKHLYEQQEAFTKAIVEFSLVDHYSKMFDEKGGNNGP